MLCEIPVRDSRPTPKRQMTANLPYFHVRDGVYQYERRVPLCVQRDRPLYEARFQSRPLFRRSLRTKRLDEATRAYQAAHHAFETLIAPVASTSMPVPLVQTGTTPSRMVTDHDLVAIATRYAALTAEPFETLHRRANVSATAAAELTRQGSDLELDAEAIQEALRSRDSDPSALVLQPVTEAALLIAEHNFFAPEGSEHRGAVIGAVRNGIEQGYRRVGALSRGDVLPTLGSAVAPLKPVNTLTLSDAVDSYLTARKPPVKAMSETRLALRQFEQAVGRKSLAALTRDDVHRFVEFLSNQKVGGKTAGSVVRHLSEHSIRKRLRMLGSAVNHVRDRGLFDGENLIAGIKVAAYAKIADKAVMPAKRRLQVSELNAILSHPWFTGCASPSDTYRPGEHRLTGAEYWVPIVALFTGCRAAELGGLKVSEVMLDDPHPHIIVRDNEYRRTKSKRTRRVPLLDALITLGFPAYVEGIRSGGHDRVFPDWTARARKGAGDGDYPAWSNSGVIRAFNRQVIPTCLADKLPADARREVTFHSLRGAFKAMLAATNNVPPIIVDEVVGHAHSDLDGRYIGEVTYPAIRHCNYKGLYFKSISSTDTSVT